MANTKPSVSHQYIDGDITFTGKNIQTISSHGNETVSDSATAVTVKHSLGLVNLTQFESNEDGLVHIPIHNPTAMTKDAQLRYIFLDFDGTNDGSVKSVTLSYGNASKLTKADFNHSKTSYLSLSDVEAKTCTYIPPNGICVSLGLGLPKSSSVINLYSVVLVYEAT
jgi:hypothetical protein